VRVQTSDGSTLRTIMEAIVPWKRQPSIK
jgi:hypothetical protein